MKLGLMANARITDLAIVQPSRLVDNVYLGAVAARSLVRAEKAATEWGVPVAYGNYEELIADDSLDAIYIATPAALHGHWTFAALSSGKHVLCEKPLAANSAEAHEIIATSKAATLILMEAFHWRYHPFVDQVRSAIDEGISDIHRVEAVFKLPKALFPDTDIRWDLSLGGGALMDLGCYALQWVRWAVGTEPSVVSAIAKCPVRSVDGALSAELAWNSGVTGSIECSMIEPGREREQFLRVFGASGTLTVVNLLAPHQGAHVVVDNAHGRNVVEADSSTTTYYHQLIAFRDAVNNGVAPITSGDNTLANMELIDACYIAAGLQPRPSHPG